MKAIVDMPEVEFHKLRMAGTLKGELLEPSDLELLKFGLISYKLSISRVSDRKTLEEVETLLKKLESL